MAGSRLRAPACPFVVFAARGRADHCAAGGTRQGRPPAGARAHRHRQHVRCARILRETGRFRHPADRRLRARGRFRRSGRGSRWQRAGGAGRAPRIVLLAAREAGYRSLMRLNSRAFLETPPNEPPHIKLAWLEGETEGLIALTGGPGGPLDAAIVAGQGGLAAARCEALTRLFGDRLYVELQRHGTDGRARRPSRRSSSSPTPRASRSSPPTSRISPSARTTRRTTRSSHCRGRARRRHRPPPAHSRAPVQDPRRDGGAVRRPAGGDRVDRRDCPALCLSAARPAPILPRFSVGENGDGGRRGGGTAPAAPKRGSSAGSQRTGSHPAAPSRSTASGSTSSSTSSRG